jgi:hypothetical protein
MAWFICLSIKAIDHEQCTVMLPFKKRNLNPFKSLYFAVQIAAAELSTGLLVLVAIDRNKNLSMLVKHVEASYTKKAVTDILFKCHDGLKIQSAIDNARITGEAVECVTQSTGYNEQNEVVCIAKITWSFKVKE